MYFPVTNKFINVTIYHILEVSPNDNHESGRVKLHQSNWFAIQNGN